MTDKSRVKGRQIFLALCGIIAGVAAGGALLMPSAPRLPTLPDALLAQARGMTVDLDNPAGRRWQAAIAEAARGHDRRNRDLRLHRVCQEAIGQKRFDAATAALLQMRDKALKLQALDSFYNAALEKCDTLPWAIMALPARGEAAADAKVSRLSMAWEMCRAQY